MFVCCFFYYWTEQKDTRNVIASTDKTNKDDFMIFFCNERNTTNFSAPGLLTLLARKQTRKLKTKCVQSWNLSALSILSHSPTPDYVKFAQLLATRFYYQNNNFNYNQYKSVDLRESFFPVANTHTTCFNCVTKWSKNGAILSKSWIESRWKEICLINFLRRWNVKQNKL